MNRREFCLATVAVLSSPAGASAAAPRARMYKSPQCSCCEDYAVYLRNHGFEVDVTPTHDLASISREAGVPPSLQGCHTLFIEGYVVDGHVPANMIRKLLAERPAIAGIALPGMPEGSPGMSGRKSAPFTVYALPKGHSPATIFAVE